MNISDVSEAFLRHQYVELNKTIDEIAAEFGLSAGSVTYRMYKFRIPRRRGVAKQRKDSVERLLAKDELVRLYLVEKRSTDYIGKAVGCSADSVRNLLKRYGLPVRTRKESKADKVRLREQ